jgi:hypothetical protein
LLPEEATLLETGSLGSSDTTRLVCEENEDEHMMIPADDCIMFITVDKVMKLHKSYYLEFIASKPSEEVMLL